jgi:hypothetical protein
MAINSGFLEGLGAGLSEIGGAVFKARVLDKLREEEEIRAEERKTAREAKQVKETRLEDKGGGNWVKRSYNSLGDMIKEDVAPANEIEAAVAAAEKTRREREKDELEIQASRKALENYDTDKELARRKTESEIAENLAQGRYADGLGRQSAGVAKASQPKSFEDTVDEFVKDNKNLFDEYVKGSDEDSMKYMSASEFRNVAREAVKAAAERGKDPRSFFADHLRRYVNDKRSSYGRRRSLDSE